MISVLRPYSFYLFFCRLMIVRELNRGILRGSSTANFSKALLAQVVGIAVGRHQRLTGNYVSGVLLF